MKKYSVLVTFLCIAQIRGLAANTNPVLIYSTTKNILVATSSKNSTVLVRNSSGDGPASDGPSLDYHYKRKKLCWTDSVQERIQCGDFDGTSIKNKVDVISSGILTPVGFACDWFTNKLYWMDSETNLIEVATMEGKYRKVLFWTDIDQPRAIALAPMKGLMFWTDWGEIPKIERAGMDGDPLTRKVIVNTNIFWPNGLTIDYEHELIYWIDAKLHFIDVMNYDGTNRTSVLTSKFQYPFALEMFQTKLYWTDWNTWSIHSYNWKARSEVEELIHPKDSIPMYLKVYNKLRQPEQSHPCEHNNGGCSHLCLLSTNPVGYSCACPIGIKLVNNLTCAEGPQELLLLARRTDICLIYLDSPENTHKTLPLKDVNYTIAVDYDPVEGFIYWSDDEVKKIQRARLNGSDQQDVVVGDIQHPDGIAVDWVSRNIYWTDAGTDLVEVCRLSSKYRRAIITDDLAEPRAIAVAPELGWLFWSDWNDKNPKVERANLDGSERKKIIDSDLGWPNGITLDLANERLYWCDAKRDKIEHSTMDGEDRKTLISDDVPHVFGFTLMDNFLYWTDWQRRTVERAHKDTGEPREVVQDQMPNVMGLKAIKLGFVSGKNLCSVNNGGCSQLCFYRHSKTKTCACQFGYELTMDRKTCVKHNTFLLYTKRNRIGMVGIENDNNEMAIPVTGINHVSAIDYETDTMRIYWSDSFSRVIMRAFMNGSDPQKVVDLSLASPEGVAIDWLALNIYWTDPTADRIEVARLMGSSRRTLLWQEQVSEPHSIVLDPPNGYMYWSEWGKSKCIKRAAMDGSQSQVLKLTKGHAYDLTLDYDNRRLYWIELNEIVTMSLDATGEKKIVSEEIHEPRKIGLTMYDNFIYWSDNYTGEIVGANKYDGSNRRIMQRQLYNVTDLQVYYTRNHKKTNPCATSNAGCSHLCLAVPAPEHVSYICACPTHYTLVGSECVPPEQFMIYSQKNLTVRLLPTPAGCLEAVLPIQGLKGVKAIEFDPVDKYLYWIEGKSPSIKRADVTGGKMATLIPTDKELQPFDLAIDVIGRLLFWTCATQNVINVTRLNDTTGESVPFGVVQKENEKPRLLVIHPTKRLLFYTDVGAGRQLIRTRLDGSHRLIITKDADIAAIAVDPENDIILWAQGCSIYMSNIEGENQHVLLNYYNGSKITELTVLSGWLYWIDHESSLLLRVELLSGNFSLPALSLQAAHIVDLISVTKPNLNHPCSQKKCSHLCILDGNNAMCACPKGNVLKEDKRTCHAVENCGPNRFTCVTTTGQPNCIPILWTCDGQKDCLDGSDETNCSDCLQDQFRCNDGQCISSSNVCDGLVHCGDSSDEDDCCRDGFQCPNGGKCLPLSLVCDKVDHCSDGADEHPSHCNSLSKVKASSNTLIWVFLGVSLFLMTIGGSCCWMKKRSVDELRDQSEDSLSPIQPKPPIKIRKGIPDVVRMSLITGSETSYDRSHITGASSSTNESSLTSYPREPLNPPPSPATTRGSSPSSRYRPYRHYRSINQPPPPTPCSTDVCDESDCNYPTRGRYDSFPYPPPPTPRSHCHSESCPPSPSSRSSTYFNPLPPPPSPVASPHRGYDS